MKGWTPGAADKATSRQNKPAGGPVPFLPSSTPPPPPSAAQGAEETGQRVTFAGVVPGNNGPGGLLRMGWRARGRLARDYDWVVAAHRLAPMAGPVRLELVRYTVGGQLDYDNLVSTGKLLVDALVRCGTLPDDNPAVIAQRDYRQERAAGRGEQRTVIRLIPL